MNNKLNPNFPTLDLVENLNNKPITFNVKSK